MGSGRVGVQRVGLVVGQGQGRQGRAGIVQLGLEMVCLSL